MPDEQAPLFCFKCEAAVSPADFAHREDMPGPLCPGCGEPLVSQARTFGEGLRLVFGLRLVGFVARQVLKSDFLAQLRQKAERTANPFDDFAVQAVASFLREVSKL